MSIGDDDLSVFFDPEEFGEAVHLDGVAGVAIWDRPTADARFGGGTTVVDVDTFQLPALTFPAPAAGQILTVDRTGERFSLYGEPRRDDAHWAWRCSAIPAS